MKRLRHPFFRKDTNIRDYPLGNGPRTTTKAAESVAAFRNHNLGMQREHKEYITARLRPILETIRQIGKEPIPDTLALKHNSNETARSAPNSGHPKDMGPGNYLYGKFHKGQEIDLDDKEGMGSMVSRQEREYHGNPPAAGYDVAPHLEPRGISINREIMSAIANRTRKR